MVETTLCVAVSDAALASSDRLESLVGAVTYKRYRRQEHFPRASTFFDTSLSIIDPQFAKGLEEVGLWRLMEERSVLSLGCDMGPAALEVDTEPSGNGYPRYRLRSSRMSEDEYLERARKNVAWLRSRFAGAIRLENLNYFPTASGAYEPVCDPGFVARLLEAVDAELLLDLAHGLISCENLGLQTVDYFGALPLHRVREVQVSACGMVNGVWEDLHEVPGLRERELFQWVCACAPVQFVTIEYYRDPDRLVAAYQDLAAQLGLMAPRETGR